jgi:hypothetical protein
MMLFGLTAAVPVAVSAQGNSNAAHLCQKGGYAWLVGVSGETFANAGQCTSYAAGGGIFAEGIVVPAGYSVTFSNAFFQAHNVLAYGYAFNGVTAGELGSKAYGKGRVYLDSVTVGPFTNAGILTVYLSDGTCGATYTSDGNHAIVSGSASAYQVDIADAGGFCEVANLPVQNFSTGNLSVTVTVHP